MMCECVNINTPAGESAVFDIVPQHEGLDLETLVSILPNDILFAMHVSQYYGLTIQHMEVRCEMDEVTNETHLYALCKTIPNGACIKTFIEVDPLFAEEMGRASHTLATTVVPFQCYDVKDRIGDESFDMRGLTSMRIMREYNSPHFYRMLANYGTSISVNVTNMREIAPEHPHYDVLQHENLFMKAYEAQTDALTIIHNHLSPSGLAHMTFSNRVYSDNGGSKPRADLSFKVVSHMSSVNGVEVYDADPFWLVCRPPNADELLDEKNQINWRKTYAFLGEVSTLLLSDSSTLFVPEVLDHDYMLIEGRKWLKITTRPGFVPFTKGGIAYGDAEVVKEYGQDHLWSFTRMANGIEMAFPLIGELNDPTAIAYGRVPISFLHDKDNTEQLLRLFTCEEIGLRLCADTDYWVYFVLIDRYRQMRTNYDMDNKVPSNLTPLLRSRETTKLEEVLRNLLGSFISSDSIQEYVAHLDPKMVAQESKKPLALSRHVFEQWEYNCHMNHRLFYRTYLEVKEESLEAANALRKKLKSKRGAQKLLDDLMANAKRRHEHDKEEKS
jgi:hypothetical protein